MRRRVLLAVAVALAVPLRGAADIRQITNLPTNRTTSVPSISADGRYLAFSSNGNIGGLNPSPATNVFVLDLLGETTTRVTNAGGLDPSISPDGRWIAFTSAADYTRTNLDGSDEIYRYDRLGNRFYYVTRDIYGEGASGRPQIAADGKRIVFETNSNLARRNPDFSNEVWISRPPIMAVTSDPLGEGESLNPRLSANGRYVVFETTSNLIGYNLDYSQELYLFDMTRRQLIPLTNDPLGIGVSSDASISADGTYIAFVSSSNIGRFNPEGYDAVFLMTKRRPALVTSSAAGAFNGATPSVSDDGRFVAFVTSFDATGANPDRNAEIMLYDATRKSFTQVTDSARPCASRNPRISGDGTKIAFLSICDLTGMNADGSQEIFLADNPVLKLVVHSEGPLNTEVRDPEDRIVRSNLNLIPGSSYEPGDFDGDTVPEVRVSIPKALDGPYRMTLFPNVGALLTDPVTLDVALNGIQVFLANGTVESLTSNEFSFNIQGLTRPLGRLKPVNGVRSTLTLAGTLLIPPSSAVGPTTVRITDGNNNLFFDFGQFENIPVVNGRKLFRGTVNGFITQFIATNLADGSVRVTLTARGGDLSMFAGDENVSLSVVVQIGSDAYLYQRRFLRRLTGDLVLQ